MKLLCKCGNIYDFENDGGTVEGFEFIYDDKDEDNLIIHCKKCDKAIILYDPEEIE